MSQKFVQIIDFETRRIDELRDLLDRFEQQMSGTPGGPTHRLLLQDREQPGRCLAIIEFASYDDAMRNNERPEVTLLSEQLAELCTRPPVFTDCDVEDARELK
ncbi:RNA-binding protein [Streptomyces sp. SID14478]|uniref:RNA-binding protein n=1 Tax=Streptomyces sp. SID14478 TaxID=2706073 RepID=UPI0013DA0041|nr:RNA-binding protein [Streptomyces sp. SID14478]NEB78822.1 RNA-binding protein [Streptomyces sp. SID14478]